MILGAGSNMPALKQVQGSAEGVRAAFSTIPRFLGQRQANLETNNLVMGCQGPLVRPRVMMTPSGLGNPLIMTKKADIFIPPIIPLYCIVRQRECDKNGEQNEVNEICIRGQARDKIRI
jgi:hypothetical protein